MGAKGSPQSSRVEWCPGSVLEPTLWMLSLLNLRSDPKLHSSIVRPKGCLERARLDQGSPREVQERLERGSLALQWRLPHLVLET